MGNRINGTMYGNRWLYLQDFTMNEAANYCVTICLKEVTQGDNLKSSTIISYTPNFSGGSWENGTLYYNLTNGNYLLSANGTITVNGVSKQNGDVLDQPGVYEIVCTDGSAESTTTVVLYRLGNVHADGNVDVRDLVAMKKISLNVTENASQAGLRGADLNQDGVVDYYDFLELRNMILNGENKVAGDTTYFGR